MRVLVAEVSVIRPVSKKPTRWKAGQCTVEYALVLALTSVLLGLLSPVLRTSLLAASTRFIVGTAQLP